MGAELQAMVSFTPLRLLSSRDRIMKRTRLSLAAPLLMLTACGGGLPGPPALAYQSSPVQDARYDYSNETVVSLSVMGQSMEMSQEGTAEFVVSFGSDPSGVQVTMSVDVLSATITQPLGAPVQVDEGSVDGSLVFLLDRMGNATPGQMPSVGVEASQMVSGLSLAHTFFPGLPGRAVAPDDVWVDTVTYNGDDGSGPQSETTILEYTVVGDTVVAGRSLLAIEFSGTAESSSSFDVGGMAISQASELAVEGHVLWDYQAGAMFESYRVGTGSGTVSVPIMPGPVPITVESVQTSRLQEMQ